jgi:hypothetical protein
MVTVGPEIVATDSLEDVYVICNPELAIASKVKVKGRPLYVCVGIVEKVII